MLELSFTFPALEETLGEWDGNESKLRAALSEAGDGFGSETCTKERSRKVPCAPS